MKQFLRLHKDWPKVYPASKQDTLWKTFRHKPVEVLEFCITQALKRSHYAPTLAEIEGQETNYREMQNAKQKSTHKRSAQQFYEGSSYCTEEETQMMRIIKARIAGKVTDKDYEDFKRGLADTALKKEMV